MHTEPVTMDDWQVAVDAAHGFLTLESVRLLGFVTGGPDVNVDRCEVILARGAALGVAPAPDAMERLVAGLLRGDTR